MRKELQALVEVQAKRFDKVFSCLEHQLCCGSVPAASLRLTFIRHDATGEQNVSGVINLLLGYLTQYCLRSERRKNLDEFQRNLNNQRARELFRTSKRSGQAGEFLAYIFIEALLQAPQIYKKMPITTNTEDERKGSDGVHLRVSGDDFLELIFAEAKLYKDFGGALRSAFASMEAFHVSKTKLLEKYYATNALSELPLAIQDEVTEHLEGIKIDRSREVYACFLGYDWQEYECLSDHRRAAFVKEFDERYKAWAEGDMAPRLNERIGAFPYQHIRFEFFFLPFIDVESFRTKFLNALGVL